MSPGAVSLLRGGGDLRQRWIALFVVALAVCSSVQAQEDEKARPPKPKPDCLDGAVYDDKKFESGLRPSSLPTPATS